MILKCLLALFLFLEAPAYASFAPITHSQESTSARLLTEYEKTKDKNLLTTIEKVSEHEQRTQQNRDNKHFWFITIMGILVITFVFSFCCIMYDSRQKRYNQQRDNL